MKKDNHLIVKKYLEEHSLVESNIISFNEFIEHRMQELVDELSGTMDNEEFEITLGKVEVKKPNIKDYSSVNMKQEGKKRLEKGQLHQTDLSEI